MTTHSLQQEFDRQVNVLLQKNYFSSDQFSGDEIKQTLDELKNQLPTLQVQDADLDNGVLPFVIVVKSSVVPIENAMASVEKDGRFGVTKLFPLQPTDFETIKEVVIPDSDFYLLEDIDRGKESINLPPSEAMELILQKRRSPLTIEEGVAIVTHYPEFLMKNNCYSLLASRHVGDQRVPAIWINGQKQPNLGWCWNGNPHTWLGSASCKMRLF